MPVIKELRDLVELLGEHDERHQRHALSYLLRVLNHAEQEVADSHLNKEERRAVQEARRMQDYERRFGKAAADDLRRKLDEIRRADDED